ncbi:DUF1642 domain-containing protein [Streptococcus suis]|nr:DUF1642 domain-containing protein [Streptococcus suis]
MNKQEAIEKIKNIDTLNINDRIAGQQVDMVIKNQVLDLISQIDQPQKVSVPKFVAEWLKEYQYANTLLKVLNAAEDERIITSDVNDWILDNQEHFIRAWLDGFEIEQEKLYTVEIPNNGGFIVLAYINHAMKLVDGNKHLPGKFTKESIEFADFGWVFDCSGVKVVEVE